MTATPAPPRYRRASWIAAAAALHLLALAVLGPGKDPDTEVGAVAILAVASIFCIWWMGLRGWGRWWARRLSLMPANGSTELWLELALGAAFASLAGATLGHLGLIGPGSRWGWAALTYAGLLWVGPPIGARDARRLPRARRATSVVLATIAVIVALRLSRALTPWGQSDPLFYQILAPRAWLDLGAIALPPRMPILFEAGAWEYIHLWGSRMVSAEPGRGLIEGQIFAQLTHVAVGYLGTCAAAFALARQVLKLDRLSAAVAALAASSVRDLLWVAHLAKNDWGCALWVLASATLALRDRKRDSWQAPLAAGALLGMAVGAKLTNGFVALALIIASAAVATSGRRARSALTMAAGAAIFALPVYLRNAWVTGNPVFPFLDGHFPSPAMTPGLRATIAYYENAAARVTLGSMLQGLLRLFTRQEALLLPALLLPLLAARRRAPAAALATWSAAAAGMVALASRPALYETRHFGAALVLLAAMGPACVAWACRWARASPAVKRALVLVTALACLVQADVLRAGNYGEAPLYRAVREAIERPSADAVIRSSTHLAGGAKAWLRLHAAGGERILTMGDRQHYYLSHFDVSAFNDDAALVERVDGVRDPEIVLREFARTGARYLLDSLTVGGIEPRSRFIQAYLARHPEVVAFRSADAVVVDLARLR